MDTEKILIAIEEKKKWEERAVLVEKQLEELKAKKTKLNAELKNIEEKLRYYGTLADSLREYTIAKASGLYFTEGGKRFK
jgi:chromosome segregation ATPase